MESTSSDQAEDKPFNAISSTQGKGQERLSWSSSSSDDLESWGTFPAFLSSPASRRKESTPILLLASATYDLLSHLEEEISLEALLLARTLILVLLA